mmetsp:Transcript_39961/g.125533  ORF Transcript_39961/g.125533 Transcript_39961/m.125533 type:complete len:219 (+) Transcript_39961:582-1238(+)
MTAVTSVWIEVISSAWEGFSCTVRSVLNKYKPKRKGCRIPQKSAPVGREPPPSSKQAAPQTARNAAAHALLSSLMPVVASRKGQMTVVMEAKKAATPESVPPVRLTDCTKYPPASHAPVSIDGTMISFLARNSQGLKTAAAMMKRTARMEEPSKKPPSSTLIAPKLMPERATIKSSQARAVPTSREVEKSSTIFARVSGIDSSFFLVLPVDPRACSET